MVPTIWAQKDKKANFYRMIFVLATGKIRFINRINDAIVNYQKLTPVFKSSDYQHLQNWKEVFEELSNKVINYV